MTTITLHKCPFYAHHGLHEEERVLGTTFEVSAIIDVDSPDDITSIHDTVNYVEVYKVIRAKMEHPVALLETVASGICDEIYLLDNRIKNIKIKIHKLNPPIEGFMGDVSVSINKSY